MICHYCLSTVKCPYLIRNVLSMTLLQTMQIKSAGKVEKKILLSDSSPGNPASAILPDKTVCRFPMIRILIPYKYY